MGQTVLLDAERYGLEVVRHQYRILVFRSNLHDLQVLSSYRQGQFRLERREAQALSEIYFFDKARIWSRLSLTLMPWGLLLV